MHDLFIWYLAVEVLGLAALPLAALAFANLPDRGWSLAKPLAILLLGVVCWLPAIIIPALPYSQGWIVASVLLFIAGNVTLLMLRPQLAQDIWRFIRQRWVYVIVSEALFAGTLWFMGWLRAFSPTIEGTEKFMDEAFLASIIHTQHLPPPDPWLAGYPINYYYFGHFLIGTLAKLLGTPASVALNIGIALTAALVATAIFGVASNLSALILVAQRGRSAAGVGPHPPAPESPAPLALARFLRRRLSPSSIGEGEIADTFAVSTEKSTLAIGSPSPLQMARGSGGEAAPQGAKPKLSARSASTPKRAEKVSRFAEQPNSFASSEGEATLALNRTVPFGLFAVVAMLVLGNLRSIELWWHNMGSLAAAVSWFTHPAQWTNFDVWWPASRALPAGTITEFPIFSFMLADLHAHVLALPYVVMALGVALNFWLAPPKRGWAAFGAGWRAAPTLIVAGLTIGGLYLMNGWDLPTYLGIALIAIVLHQWNAHERMLSSELGISLLQTLAPFVVACFIFYLPFYLNFNSPSQGIGLVTGTSNHVAISVLQSDACDAARAANPNVTCAIDPMTRTTIGDELGANGIMLFLLGSWLLTLLAQQLARFLQRGGLAQARIALDRVEMPASALTDPGIRQVSFANGTMGEIESSSVASAVTPVSVFGAWNRSWAIVGLIAGMLALITWATSSWDGWTLLWSLIFVIAATWLIATPLLRVTAPTAAEHAQTFPLLLIGVGVALIGVCELVFLRDVFAGSAPRMNTVFKLYYQAWTLFAVASGPALAWIVIHFADKVPGKEGAAWQPVAYLWRGAWALVLALVLIAALVYPLGISHNIYLNGQKSTGTLDGLTTINGYIQPGDMRGMEWLRDHVTGSPTIVEAMIGAAEYSTFYGRVSVFTGLPTIIGWYGHEEQWRFNWITTPPGIAAIGPRLNDVQTIYTSADPAVVLGLLHHYGVQYVYVGPVELQTYGTKLDQSQFSHYLQVVYNADGVIIYHVPNS